MLLGTGRSTRCLGGRGLTALLRRAFYPKYDYHNVKGKLSAKGAGASKAVGGFKKGMERGRLVDAELSKWADRGTPVRHAYARKFLAWCKREKYTPVASQVCVADAGADVGTLVDLVLADARGRLLVVELKCGFQGHYDAYSGRLRAPFADATDCPRNQHLLQLAFSVHMFRATFPELGAPRAALVRIVDGGVESTPLPRALMQRIAPAVEKVKRARTGRGGAK